MVGYRYVAIGGSVGQRGANRAPDVAAIQQLLNAHRPAGAWRALRVDGVCSVHTIRAIADAQRRFVGTSHPDGRIDPHGPTLRTLNAVVQPPSAAPRTAAPSVCQSTASRGASATSARMPAPVGAHRHEPPRDVIDAARAAQRNWHVPASISIAQWVLESAEGRHMPRGSNNPFGIKAAGQPSVTVRTREETRDGRSFYINAPFRCFDSLAQAFDEHGRLLATHRAYAEARRHTDDPDAYADALTHHYATDTHYGSLLRGIMRARDLYRYDAVTIAP